MIKINKDIMTFLSFPKNLILSYLNMLLKGYIWLYFIFVLLFLQSFILFINIFSKLKWVNFEWDLTILRKLDLTIVMIYLIYFAFFTCFCLNYLDHLMNFSVIFWSLWLISFIIFLILVIYFLFYSIKLYLSYRLPQDYYN